MVELFDYRLFFPAEFTVSDVGIKLDLFNNEIEIGGNRYGFKQKTHVWGGEIRVDAEFDGKNIEGKNLVLSFYQDGEVGVKHGERPCPVKGVRIDAELKLIRVKYFDGNLKWKFKAEGRIVISPVIIDADGAIYLQTIEHLQVSPQSSRITVNLDGSLKWRREQGKYELTGVE